MFRPHNLLSDTGDDDPAYLPSFHVGHSFVGVTSRGSGSGIKARQLMPAWFWEAGLPA